MSGLEIRKYLNMLVPLAGFLILSSCQSYGSFAEQRLGYCHNQDGTITREAANRCSGNIISENEAKRIDAARAKEIREQFSQQNVSASADRVFRGVPLHSAGSGFVINERGDILTSAHVVEQCQIVGARGLDTPLQEAKVVVRDSKIDLAILRIDNPPRASMLFEKNVPNDGEPLAMIGYPHIRKDPKLTPLHAAYWAGDFSLGQLGLKGDVRSGNSGGPLMTSRGSIAGVIKARVDSSRAYQLRKIELDEIGASITADRVLAFLKVYGIPYELASGKERELSGREILKSAEDVTLRIDCFSS